MPFTGLRRWTQLGTIEIDSGNGNNLINANSGSVSLNTQGDIIELSAPKFADAQGTIAALSNEIPQGSIITGIQYFYPLRISATTMPAQVTTKASLSLSDSNESSIDTVVTSTQISLNLRSVGGEDDLLGLSIDPLNNTALDLVKFKFSLSNLNTSSPFSPDFTVTTVGDNFGFDSFGFEKGPYPSVRVHYKAPKVVITNPTKVVLRGGRKVTVGYN